MYFERIRDEVREGRTLVAAVEAGWNRARRTILASDAVNLLAAVVLYFLAVGGVRGFAFTLGLTTIIDLVVVFLFTHPIMQLLAQDAVLRRGPPALGLQRGAARAPGAPTRGRGRVRRAGGARGGRRDGARRRSPSASASRPLRRQPGRRRRGRRGTAARTSRAAPPSAGRRRAARRGEVTDGRQLRPVGQRPLHGQASFDIVGTARSGSPSPSCCVSRSVLVLFFKGLNPGIEFRGGSEFRVSGVATTDQSIAIDAVAEVLPAGESPRVSPSATTACGCRPSSSSDERDRPGRASALADGVRRRAGEGHLVVRRRRPGVSRRHRARPSPAW